jgi:hypothetical protein
MKPLAYFHATGGMGPHGDLDLDLFDASSAPLTADADPISLRALAKQLNTQTPRLVTRYVELAVLGAQQIKHPILPSTRLYVATGMGEIVTVDALYHQIVPPVSEMIMPARFASSGNNMAAFFVARQLGLVARNMTISLEELSLEQTLRIVALDLAAGATRAALVGAIDEAAIPREFYLSHFPLAREHCIGEGSAWLLLGAAAAGATGELLDAMVSAPNADPITLTHNVRDIASCDPIIFLPGCRLTETEIDEVKQRVGATTHLPYLQYTGYFPTAVGLAVIASFRHAWPSTTTFVHWNRDELGRIGRLVWRVYGGNREGTSD